jgi:hypothetical protein
MTMHHTEGTRQQPGDHGGQHQAEMRRCIELCTECHNVCVETLARCLQHGGEHAEPAHVRLMLDCAEICQTSANFMLRGSELHGRTCGVCADVCERCARDCAGFAEEFMQRCADACRRCAESCRQMAGTTR